MARIYYKKPGSRCRGVLQYALTVILAAVIFPYLFANLAHASPPPQDNKSYLGDCNGDFLVTSIDVGCVRDQTLGRDVDYSAVIPRKHY